LEICIFTNNTHLENNFVKSKKKSNITVNFHPYSELRKISKNITKPTIIYLDIADQTDSYQKDWGYLTKQKNIFPALLDPNTIIEDSFSLLHNGAVDYLAGPNIHNLFQEKRFALIQKYLEQYRSDYQKDSTEQENPIQPLANLIPASGWNDIKEGKEYSFYLLYIEIDDKEELEKKYNKANLSQTLAGFKAFIEKHIYPYSGRMWMWHDFGGVILFPYTSDKCQCLVSAFKIMLYRFLYDTEDSNFPHFISFRMAMHLGNLVYCRCRGRRYRLLR